MSQKHVVASTTHKCCYLHHCRVVHKSKPSGDKTEFICVQVSINHSLNQVQVYTSLLVNTRICTPWLAMLLVFKFSYLPPPWCITYIYLAAHSRNYPTALNRIGSRLWKIGSCAKCPTLWYYIFSDYFFSCKKFTKIWYVLGSGIYCTSIINILIF